MILQRYLFWLLILMLGLNVTSCDNDDDDDDGDNFRNRLTISQGWRLDDIDSNLDDNDLIEAFIEANDEAASGVTDENLEIVIRGLAQTFENVDTCEMDDTYIFLTNGTINYVAGSEDCDETDLSAEELFGANTQWTLNGDKLTLATSGTDSLQFNQLEIETLNENTMVLKGSTDITEADFGYDITDKDFEIRVTFKAR